MEKYASVSSYKGRDFLELGLILDDLYEDNHVAFLAAITTDVF